MKIIGLLTAVLLTIATPCPAQTTNQSASALSDDNSHYGWADVLRVDPVYNVPEQTVPKQECWEEQVPIDSSDSDDRDSSRGVASVVGAIIGGLIGHQVGHGHGRTAATAAGAVAGGVIGNNIAAANERDDVDRGDEQAPRYKVVRRCRTVDPPVQRRIIGYDVEYRYRGDIYTARLLHDPGDRLRVRVSVTPVE